MTLTTRTIGNLPDTLTTLQNGDWFVVDRAGTPSKITRQNVAADVSTALALGTMATQAAASVAITGGTIAGITDLAIADGGTGASTAAGARTALGSTTVGDALFVAADAAAARTAAGLGSMSTQAANNVNIDGGTIDGTPIGGSAAAAGAFTSGTYSSRVTIENTQPQLYLKETDEPTAYRVVSLEQVNGGFGIRTREDDGTLVSTDYFIDRNASGATSHSFRIAGTERLSLTTDVTEISGGTGAILANIKLLNTEFGNRVHVSSTMRTRTLTPQLGTDNIGDNTNRYGLIYLNNSPNVSSDARLKEDIADLTETERAAAAKIKARTFTMIDSGQKKIGYIAQEVETAMTSEGLCAIEYGLVTIGEDDMRGVDMDAINAFRLG